MISCLRISVVGWALAVCLASVSLAADPVAVGPISTAPPSFRRIYVPGDRLDQWPRDAGVRYRPVPKAEFDRLVELLQSSPADIRSAVAARLASAHYTARLEDDLLTGQATLNIVRNANHRAERDAPLTSPADRGALMSLAPCGLAIDQAYWQKTPQEVPLLGLDSRGRLSVLVHQSDSLQLHWTLRGQRDLAGMLTFQGDVPAATITRLYLDLPPDVTPRLVGGVVVDSAPADGNRKRWQVELGSQTRFTLTLPSGGNPAARSRPPLLRQALVYEVSPRAVEITAELTLDVFDDPVRQIEFTLDPGLRLLAARQDEAAVPWSQTIDERSGVSRVVLELPSPAAGTGRVIRLRGVAPIALASLWRLPSLRVQGMFWQEGKATLLVPKPLVLEQLVTTDCRQTDLESLPAPQLGDSLSLRCFVPEAAIEVIVAYGRQRLHVASAAAIELGEDQTTGQVVVECRLAEGELFHLQAGVPNPWTIDAIESNPPGAVRDWFVETTAGPNKRLLEVRLARALSSNTPLRLVITGHRLSTAIGETHSPAELSMVDFSAEDARHQFMAIRTVGAYELKLTRADELQQLDPRQLDPIAAGLFLEPPRGLLFRLDDRAARLRLALVRQAARYTTHVRVEALATAGPLWETYRIQCVPQIARVERVVVHFSQSRASDPIWALGSEGEEQLTARRLASTEDGGAQAAGETWEVLLRRPSRGAFEIRASRAVELDRELPISLAATPEAESQTGTLVIRSTPETALEIKSQALEPLLLESQSADATGLLRAMFRYSPAEVTGPAPKGSLNLVRGVRASTMRAGMVWNQQLESRFEPSGKGQHVATFRLQNEGRTQVTFTLPASYELLGAWVDDARPPQQHKGGKLTVELPAGRRFPTVVVCLASAGNALGIVSRIEGPRLVVDLPVAAAQWSVWLPWGFAVSLDDRFGRGQAEASLSITERFFGPLARPRSMQPFDALMAEEWLALARTPLARREAEAQADAVVRQLGLPWPLAVNADTSTVTWSQHLGRAQEAVARSNGLLLIDWQALARSGIGPQTPLPKTTAKNHSAHGLALLETANLALLVESQTVVLSTSVVAASQRDQLVMLQHPALNQVLPGRLANRILRAAQDDPATGLIPVDDWSQEPPLPWSTRRGGSLEAADLPAWQAYRQPLTDSPLELTVVRRASLDVLAWAALLLVALAGYRKLIDRPIALVVLSGALGIVALLVPATYAPLASGAFLGGVACLVSTLWRQLKQPRNLPSQASRGSRPTESAITVGAWLLAAALATPTSVQGEDPPTSSEKRVHKVFIPIDAQRKPSGEHFWVPDEFYRELEGRAAALSLAPQGWSLVRAEYHGVLDREAAQQKLVVAEFRARFDLHVFNAPCRVRLPLGRGGLRLMPDDRVLVEGQETAVQWEQNDRMLSFDVEEAGLLRCELSLRPALTTQADATGFDLAIPPLASAQLTLRLPSQSPLVEVPSARGAVLVQAEGERLTARLGAADRLTVRWREGAPARAAKPVVDVEELLWLKVQPGSVMLSGRIKFRVLEGSLRQVQLAASPRLQLLLQEGKNPLVSQLRAVPGNPQLIEAEFSRPITDQVTLDVALQLTGTSGIGNLRVPQLEALGVRSRRRMLGVSIDAALEFQEPAVAGTVRILPAEFVAAWGGAEAAPPRLAHRLPLDATWSLATRPRKSARTVEQTLAIGVSADRAQVRFEVLVPSAATASFQHRLLTPSSLRIDSLTVHEEGVNRLARWSRDEAGILTLVLNEGVRGQHQLVLAGSLPIANRGNWPLPAFALEDAAPRPGRVRIYRQPDVLLEVRGKKGVAEHSIETAAAAEGEGRFDGLGRLVSVLAADDAVINVVLHIQPNDPQFTVRQVTTLRREAGNWLCEIDVRLAVRSGAIDALRFDLPESWSGPFLVAPHAAVSLLEPFGESQRQLLVRPASALVADGKSNEHRFKVKGPVSLVLGKPLAAPLVSLRGGERREHLVVLPTQLELQPLAWETRGLNRTELPAELASSLASPLQHAFIAVDDEWSATLRAAERTLGEPLVRLADLCVAWAVDGTVRGVCSFDLDPAGDADCLLVAPPNCQLLQVSVGAMPATLISEGGRSYRLPLGSTGLPQRVEVAFTSVATRSAWNQRRLSTPRLGDLEVERTIWTVSGPPGSSPGEIGRPRQIDALRQELVRMRAMADLTRQAANQLEDEPVERLAAWYRLWGRRWQAALTAARQELLRSRGSDSYRAAVETELTDLEDEQSRYLAPLTAAMSGLPPSGSVPAAEQPRQFWLAATDNAWPVQRCLYRNGAAELDVQVGQSPATDWLQRCFGIAGILLAASVIVLAGRGSRWQQLRRWRYLAGFAAGMAWWLWLWPSVLGLLLAALSVAAGARSLFRPAQDPDPAVVLICSSSR